MFPIVVGTGPHHSSSRPFPRINININSRDHSNDEEADGAQSGNGSEVRQQQQQLQNVIMAMGTNCDETLNATMFISYLFLPIDNYIGDFSRGGRSDSDDERRALLDDGDAIPSSSSNFANINEWGGQHSHLSPLEQQDRTDVQFNVIAELRVQITPITAPFTSNADAMSNRETKSSVPLGMMRKRSRQEMQNHTTPFVPNPSIEFSSNRKHLACLVPLPSGYELLSTLEHGHHRNNTPTSTIVIFRIQAKTLPSQRQQRNYNLPKLPDYILDNTIDKDRNRGGLESTNISSTKSMENIDMSGVTLQHESSAPTMPSSGVNTTSFVAHGPKIVRDLRPLNEHHVVESETQNNEISNRRKLSRENGNASPLQCATCMCNVPGDHYRGESSLAGSFLLIGTVDGRLLIVDFSMVRVCSVELVTEDHNDRTRAHPRELNSINAERNRKSQHSECGFNPIVHLSQCTPTHWKPLDIYGEEQGSMSKGRIAAVFRDGSVNIYTTSFVPISDHHGGLLLDKNKKYEDDSSKNPHRVRGNKSNGTKCSGLDMRVHPMATYRACMACLDASLSHLRYIRAKWINPCILVLLTRSPFLDDDELSDTMSGSQSEMVVAQVWSVAEVTRINQDIRNECAWKISSNTDASIALISELKMPRGDSLNEFIHDTFSLSQVTTSMNSKERPGFSDCTRGMSIMYHRFIDCLALGSQEVTCTSDSNTKSIRPFCLIWDWKRNVPGLTLACSNSYRLCCQQANDAMHVLPSLSSWFQLGADDQYGLCVVHVYEQTLRNGMRRACKNIFCLSALSPQNRLVTEEYLSVNEPSALLLHRDSITFPRLYRPTNSMDISLEWAESRVPPTYIASNGPCQIAALGKDYGRSIAVAASRGLCLLDLSRTQQHEFGRFGSTSQSPRWKLFSNINDEHRFRVLSMIWWECDNQDFLLAVVQYKLNDSLRLVCWSSRKGIGFGESQLLKGSINKESDGSVEACEYGVALPPRFRVQSMSLIKDPADKIPSSRSESSNRALLLLANVSHDEPASCCINYALYQLQVILPQGKQERVLNKCISHGTIPMELGSPDVPASEVGTGIFLAGGSFLFNLDIDVDDSDSHNDIAVIGIMTMYHGLVALSVRQEGSSLYRPSLFGRAHDGRHLLLVAYWMAGSSSSRHGSRIAWNIAQNDGEVYCWSVPCRNAATPNIASPEESSSEILLGIEKHPIFGEFCYLGCSSLWMNGAATSEREVALGSFVPLSFGFTLYAGQRCRKKPTPSNPVVMTSFHVSNCIVAPPQFTPFLFLSFLALSLETSRGDDCDWQLLNHPDKGSPERRNAEHRDLAKDVIISTLRQVRSIGSCASALRIITFKVIELLNDSKVRNHRFHRREILDYNGIDVIPDVKRWEVGKAMLVEIVSAARMIYDDLGFAAFFLSIGRQLEPHQFNLIFPLPAESPAATAEDLFTLSCEHGSLLSALSALPLFSCHKGSQRSVTKLVYHCLIKIDESFRSCFSNSAKTSVEDETFLHQLFWFGVKLEDAIESGNLHEEEEDGFDCASQSEEDESIFDSSPFSIVSSSTETNIGDVTDEFGSAASDRADDTSDTCSDESFEESYLSRCQTPKQKSPIGIFQRVTRRLLASSGSPINDLSQEEDAIHEAASSFILSGLGESSITSHGKDASIYNSVPCTSVAGAVCLFIDHEIVSGDCDHDMLSYGWKAVSLVAHLLQGDRETRAITSAGTANAKAISRVLTIKDFIVAYPPPNDVSDDDYCTIVASLLEGITSRCRQQIHSQALNSVFNLVLMILLRNDTCLDVKLCRPTLILVGIVSGHLSGRIGELIDFAETSTVSSIYSLYAAKLGTELSH